MGNAIKCEDCDFSSNVIKISTQQGIKKEKFGFMCCHESERVKGDGFFTGITSPNWCPLKQKIKR